MSRRQQLIKEMTRLLSVGGVSDHLSPAAAEKIVDLGLRWAEASPETRPGLLSEGERQVLDWYRSARRRTTPSGWAGTRKVRPLRDCVLVKPLAENAHHGVIVAPDIAKSGPQRGKILATGLGRLTKHGTREALDVKIGDHVLLDRYAGVEVRIDGTDYRILPERDILGVIE